MFVLILFDFCRFTAYSMSSCVCLMRMQEHVRRHANKNVFCLLSRLLGLQYARKILSVRRTHLISVPVVNFFCLPHSISNALCRRRIKGN